MEAGAGLGCQDMLGNTPAHLVVSEGTSITARDSLYTNSMEGMVDRVILDMILGMNISQVEQIQTCLLVYFFRHGAKEQYQEHMQRTAKTGLGWWWGG